MIPDRWIAAAADLLREVNVSLEAAVEGQVTDRTQIRRATALSLQIDALLERIPAPADRLAQHAWMQCRPHEWDIGADHVTKQCSKCGLIVVADSVRV